MPKEVYISVDVETSGPIPEKYSMLSLGATNVDNTNQRHYVEIKPISTLYVPRALEIAGFSLEDLEKTGKDPKEAMEGFEAWTQDAAGEDRPVFVAFNATFDWSFVNYYMHRYLERNIFGISGLDIKAYLMGKTGSTWGQTTKGKIDKKYKPESPHTHNALDDAIEQALLFRNIRDSK